MSASSIPVNGTGPMPPTSITRMPCSGPIAAPYTRGGPANRVRAMKVAYTRGLHELGDGLYTYLQPDGTWGWSNAGLITRAGQLPADRHAV